MTEAPGAPRTSLPFRLMVYALLLGGLLMGAYTWGRLGLVLERAERTAAEGRAADQEKRIETLERAHAATEKTLLDRAEAVQKRVADLEAAGRAREGDLLAARTEAERLRRAAAEAEERRGDAEREAARLEKAMAARDSEPQAEAAGQAAKAPAAKPDGGPAPAPTKPAGDRPPPPGLGPTAVTDPGQVRKVLDGLNTLLSGVGGRETFRVASAEAVDGDRLVRGVLEARGEDGSLLKSFEAGELRFVLSNTAGTLGIKLKDGSVTYPGNRTVPFPGGGYTALLVVDPAPFRASGNPLIAIQ